MISLVCGTFGGGFVDCSSLIKFISSSILFIPKSSEIFETAVFSDIKPLSLAAITVFVFICKSCGLAGNHCGHINLIVASQSKFLSTILPPITTSYI